MIPSPVQPLATLPDGSSVAAGEAAGTDGAFAILLAALLPLPLPVLAAAPRPLGEPSPNVGAGPAAIPVAGGGAATPGAAAPSLLPVAAARAGDILPTGAPLAASATAPQQPATATALLPWKAQEATARARPGDPAPTILPAGASTTAPLQPAPAGAPMPVAALQPAPAAAAQLPVAAQDGGAPATPMSTPGPTPTLVPAAPPVARTDLPSTGVPPVGSPTAVARTNADAVAQTRPLPAAQAGPPLLEGRDPPQPEVTTPSVTVLPAAGLRGAARPDTADTVRAATSRTAAIEPGVAAADGAAGEPARPAAGGTVAEGLDLGHPARLERAAGEPLPAAPRSLPAPPAALQVGVQIAAAAARRVERLVVQLEPAALGRVEVRLDFSHDNRVSALIAADRPETLDLLQRDGRALERSLQDAGLKLDGDGLSFSLRQEQRHPQERGGAPHTMPSRGSPADPAATGDAEPARLTRWLGVERVLDISI
jgi:hypothetical protein